MLRHDLYYACSTRVPPYPIREGNGLVFGAGARTYEREETAAVVSVFDITGRKLWTGQSRLLLGNSALAWDGQTNEGHRAGSGIYILRARSPDGRVTIRRQLVVR